MPGSCLLFSTFSLMLQGHNDTSQQRFPTFVTP